MSLPTYPEVLAYIGEQIELLTIDKDEWFHTAKTIWSHLPWDATTHAYFEMLWDQFFTERTAYEMSNLHLGKKFNNPFRNVRTERAKRRSKRRSKQRAKQRSKQRSKQRAKRRSKQRASVNSHR